jgi:hypothetical protein
LIYSSSSASIINGLQGFNFWSNSARYGPNSSLSLYAFTEVTSGSQIGYINGNATVAGIAGAGLYVTSASLPVTTAIYSQISNASGFTYFISSGMGVAVPGGMVLAWVSFLPLQWRSNTSAASLTINVNQPGNSGPSVLTTWQGFPSLAIPGTGANSSVTNYLTFPTTCLIDGRYASVNVSALGTNILLSIPHFTFAGYCPIAFGSKVMSSGIQSLALSFVSMLLLAFVSGILVF